MSTATYITTSAEQEIANLPSIEPREELDDPQAQIWATIKGEAYPLEVSGLNGIAFAIRTYNRDTRQYIEVNGVPYYFTFYFATEGTRACRTPGGLRVEHSSISRQQYGDPTPAASRAIWDGVFAAADEFASSIEGQALLAEAAVIDRHNQIRRAERKIQDAIDQAARLIEQLEVTR